MRKILYKTKKKVHRLISALVIATLASSAIPTINVNAMEIDADNELDEQYEEVYEELPSYEIATDEDANEVVTVEDDDIGELVLSYRGEEEEQVDFVEEQISLFSLDEMDREGSSYLDSKYISPYVTPIKNQNPYGSCWAHAACASSEANILKKGLYDDPDTLDLSEAQLAYFTNKKTVVDPMGLTAGDSYNTIDSVDNFLNIGGNQELAIGRLVSWAGYVDEADAPYDILRNNQSTVKTYSLDDSYAYEKDKYHLQNAMFVNMNDIENVKKLIVEYGACGTSYHHADAYYNKTANSEAYSEYCYESGKKSNHAITIIGWDDNYSKENFYISGHKPSKDGAWYVKNSWGPMWGGRGYGYFWMSYEDMCLITKNGYFYDVEPADNYDHNYYYDGGLADGSFSPGTTGGEANVFKAADNQTLEAVGFYTRNSNYTCKLSIYTDCSSGRPTSGKKVAEMELPEPYAGYHTVKLDNPIKLTKGQTFSIALEYNCENGVKINVDIESKSSGWYINTTHAETGQSFYYRNGSWSDVSSTGYNCRVKAYTNDVAEPTTEEPTTEEPTTEEPTTEEPVAVSNIVIKPETPILEVGETSKLTVEVYPEDATYSGITWSSSDKSIVTVSSSGLISGVARGKAQVTATVDGVSQSVDVYIYNVGTTVVDGDFAGRLKDTGRDFISAIIHGYDISNVELFGTRETVRNSIYNAIIQLYKFEVGFLYYIDDSITDEGGKISAAIDAPGAKIAGEYSMFAEVFHENKIGSRKALGYIRKLNKPTEITMDFPKSLPEVPEGMNRTYYMVCVSQDGSKLNYNPIDVKVIDNRAISIFTDVIGKYILLYCDVDDADGKTYNIVFNGNTATSGTMANMSGTYRDNGSAQSISANTYKKTGYSFKGWNTKADGTGTAYSNKCDLKTFATDEKITLYAQWTKVKYTITYSLKSGTNNVANPSYYYVTTSTITLAEPTRTGFTFVGWYTDAEYTTKITEIKKGSTGNKTVYARWTPNKYTIKFNGNGATSGTMSSMTGCKYNVEYELTANTFKKTGYHLYRWNTKADGTGTSYKNKEVVKNLSSKSGATVTLYAIWTKNQYSIEFDGNGATSGSMAILEKCKYGSTYTLSANAFKRKGYTFTGWNTKADGTGTDYANKASVKNLTTSNGKVVKLYAQWKKTKYTITYNLNGGVNNTGNPASYYVTSQITLLKPTRSGYTFKGWYKDSSYTTKVTEITKGSTGNITLYAKWVKK